MCAETLDIAKHALSCFSKAWKLAESLEAFALESGEKVLASVVEYLEEKLKGYEGIAERLRRKYGCSCVEFKERLGRKRTHTWEEEADLFDWEAALTEAEELRELLASLER